MSQQTKPATTVHDTVASRVSMPSVARSMIDQVEQLVRLLLTNPASSAEAERSYSSLRKLKTYMRSSITEERVIHCAVLHVHQHKLDALDIHEIA